MKSPSLLPLPSFPATRMRRVRENPYLRRLTLETQLTPSHLIQPLFICEGEGSAIETLPGLRSYGIDEIGAATRQLSALGIQAIMLFPQVPEERKTPNGEEAWNPEGLVPQAVLTLVAEAPKIAVITDVALDPYTSHGQDGVLDEQGRVNNDATVEALTRQALCQARAGCDIIAPSDMMDGRVAVLRQALEHNGLKHVAIISYAAKYASSLYSPFRDAVGSAKQLAGRDKRGYQLDCANADEALRECALDVAEGADVLLIKPATPCLDIIWRVRQSLALPVFAYQVSGEYAMLCAAFERGWLPRKQLIIESLTAIRRAGASAVVSYFAAEAAQWLAECEPQS